MEIIDLLEKLNRTLEETTSYFDLPENQLLNTYGEGKWNIRQILHHLTDAETVLYDRIRRAISKPNQVVWGFDQEAWEKGLEYNKFPLHLNKNIYTSVRNSIIYLVDEYYESLGGNEYVHNETGKRMLKDEFDKVAWHNEGHLVQIRIALQKED